MSNLITNNLAAVMSEVQDLQRTETPGACLTLTRSATLAITTAGTTITWQTETRSNGFTWSTTDITIPTTGFYCMSLTYNANASHTAYMRLNINGNNVIHMTGDNVGSTTRHGYMWLRYFAADDVLNFTVVPSANVTIQVNAEGAVSESPFFHIVQMTGSQT